MRWTHPAIAPVQAPTTENFRSSLQSMSTQTMPPTEAAILVFMMAMPAFKLAAKVEPPYKTAYVSDTHQH